jgi:spermidine synthase
MPERINQGTLPVQRKNEAPLPIAVVLFLFFISGALALVYQVVWSRMMMQIFGSTAIAVGTVLAAFMCGMAIGSWWFGKLADRSTNCFRLYAWLELGIAVTALGSHFILHHVGPAYPIIHKLFESVPAVLFPIRFVMAFLLVMLPTVFMGATLPVLTRFLVGRKRLVGIDISTLYAVNIFGAVSGVLLTGFFLIGKYGIHVPVYLAVCGNLAVGFIAWFMSQGLTQGAVVSPETETEPGPGGEQVNLGPGIYRLILFGLGVSGFTSFAYEIYWTRSLVFILGNSTYALTTMLSAFLTGIAIGGWLIRYLLVRVRDRTVIFGWIQLALGVFSALALPLLFSISDPQSLNQQVIKSSSDVAQLLFAGYGVAFLVMLLPAILIGTTFPLVVQIATRDLRQTGSSVGRIYAINTIGNVFGALFPGFFLLSWLGIQKGILAMAALNAILGMIILFLRLFQPSRHPAWRLVLPLALIIAGVSIGQTPLQFQFPSEGERRGSSTLFYREGPLATTKVYRNPGNDEKHMSVDGIVIGGTGYSEFKQLLLAHLPKLLLDDVTTELSVGLGSGILVGESALHSRVRQITGVEIEPGVIAGAKQFADENHHILENPRLKVVLDDIGNFLRTHSGNFQVVSADEKTADEYASNGFSYSREYYDLLRLHLAPGGLVAQWVPTTLPPRQYCMVLNTFARSFPHVQLWYFLPAHKRGPFNTILVGSNKPIPIDFAQVDRRFSENRAAFESLVPYGLTSAEALLPHFIADEKVIREAVADSPVNSLDHPHYEFFYPWDYAINREMKFLANHEFLIDLKTKSHAAYFAGITHDMNDDIRARRTFAAEFRYLQGFQKFLSGIPLDENYRIFDDALAVAPWNDSLRARIYAQYAHLANTRRDPVERMRAERRAADLYQENP